MIINDLSVKEINAALVRIQKEFERRINAIEEMLIELKERVEDLQG